MSWSLLRLTKIDWLIDWLLLNVQREVFKIYSGWEQVQGLTWSWSYGSWIYNYLCNQCLSPLTWVQIWLRGGALNTTLSDKVCLWLAAGLWFSPGSLVSSTNKTDHHDIAEILLKVALNTINQPKPSWIETILFLI